MSTQNITDPTLGPALLDALAAGASADRALAQVVGEAERVSYRQLAVVDSRGGTAAYSGEDTLGRHVAAQGTGCLATGNLLSNDDVPAAMIDAFEAHPDDHLAARLLAALQAGDAAGGEEGPVHSCGLLVVDKVSWPTTDLRVDWSERPLLDLARLWAIWGPQEADYVRRALDPAGAPSYRVPGDE